MASSSIWKPATNDGNPAFLTDINNPKTPPVLVLADGTQITGRLKSSHEGRHKYTFPPSVLGQAGAHIQYNGQSYPIENTSQSYEGMGPDWKARAKGSLGGGSTGTGGAQQIGEYGFAPQFIGDKFPKAVTTDYQAIPGAGKDYQYIDPIKFGQEFNPFARQELGKNYQQAGDLALGALDTEFAGLASYAAKSTILKMGVTAADNAFNQAQRTNQVNTAIPDVVSDLNQQAADARTYASGEAPNAVVNQGLEIGVRSAAADVAATSGFGVGSSAARKTSDLMSARERIGLSQYGNQLLSGNAAQRAQLFLAPTEYSNAGEQINVNPSLSASQLQQANFSSINQNVSVPGSQAFSSAINQSQFITGLDQRNQEFNASNTLQNDQFNAGNLNNFALSYFNYLNSYANSVAGAAQTNSNVQVGIDQQQKAIDFASRERDRTQTSNTISSIIGGAGSIIGGVIGGAFRPSGLGQGAGAGAGDAGDAVAGAAGTAAGGPLGGAAAIVANNALGDPVGQGVTAVTDTIKGTVEAITGGC